MRPPFLPGVTVPPPGGGLWESQLGQELPGRVGDAGSGAGGSVLLPPAPRCPSENRLLPFSSWRFTFYLIAFIAGMAVIVDVSIAPLPCSPSPPGPSDSVSPPPHPTEALVLRPPGGVEGISHPGEHGSCPSCQPSAFPERQDQQWELGVQEGLLACLAVWGSSGHPDGAQRRGTKPLWGTQRSPPTCPLPPEHSALAVLVLHDRALLLLVPALQHRLRRQAQGGGSGGHRDILAGFSSPSWWVGRRQQLGGCGDTQGLL